MKRNSALAEHCVLAALITENRILFSHSNDFNYGLPLVRCFDQLMSVFINCRLKPNQAPAPNSTLLSINIKKLNNLLSHSAF